MTATRTTRLVALFLAAFAVVALTGCKTTVVSAPANSSLNTVTASGSGTVSAIPDQASMTFGVSSQNADAKKALDDVSGKAAKITDAVKKAGVADKDIQTAGVNVYPQYASDGRKVTGYQASLSVRVKVRDLASLSKVIEAASAAGASEINGPTFTLDDDAAARNEAVQKAVDDARTQAAAMAKAAGKSVGAVVSITSTGSSNGGPVPLFAADATAAGKASVPIQSGQLDVTSSVTVVFELK